MTWNEFRDRLHASLRNVTGRCCLVVLAPDERGCVQFLGSDEALLAEASGPESVTVAAGHATDDPAMLAAGWAPPAGPQPNWSYELELPALTGESVALADRCVVALRDVFHVADPAVLVYRAWREPEAQPSGVTWQPERFDDLDPGENPLPLPELGLQPQPA